MKIINNLNKHFFNSADNDSNYDKKFEVSEQKRSYKENKGFRQTRKKYLFNLLN